MSAAISHVSDTAHWVAMYRAMESERPVRRPALDPPLGATPTWSGVLDLAPIQRPSPFYLAGGIGLISGRHQEGDKLSGWVQGTAAYRSPIHELTPFVQVGSALQRQRCRDPVRHRPHTGAPHVPPALRGSGVTRRYVVTKAPRSRFLWRPAMTSGSPRWIAAVSAEASSRVG